MCNAALIHTPHLHVCTALYIVHVLEVYILIGMATKLYRGLLENGKWEEFEASDVSEAVPSVSGYEKVEDAQTGEEITD